MWTKSVRSLAVIAGLFVLFVFAGCSDDTATASSCTSDANCALGSVCGANNTCVVASCDLCTPEQICYTTPSNPEGSCSAPECSTDAECANKGGSCVGGQCSDQACNSNDDCGDNEICSLAGECVQSDGTCTEDLDCPSGQVCSNDACVEGCSSNDDCDATEYCAADSTCQSGCRDNDSCGTGQVCQDGSCRCTTGNCGPGRFCDGQTGQCATATACNQITCPGDQVCEDIGLTCVDPCTADSCAANEVCNMQNGRCEVSNCPGEDPTQCDGDPLRPIWDPIKCFCAECTQDSDCNMAAGETCNSGGKCFACQTACQPDQPGTCMGDTPYCIDNCCLECIGAADCAQGQLCLDGFCGDPPNCQVDPSVCPTGYTCDQITGQCQEPNQGQACSQADPLSCPPGTFCDPTTNTCSGGFGGGSNPFACGLCNPDCTCDNGLSCDGFFCECNTVEEIISPKCASGTVCIPLDLGNPTAGVCFGIPGT